MGFALALQLVTGVFLALVYTGGEKAAFDRFVTILQDVNWGWFLQALHANGASLFFFLIFAHMGRGLYFGSFKLKVSWWLGCAMFVVLMATAFFGYVLPWGQMSFWACQVITGLFTSIPVVGGSISVWL